MSRLKVELINELADIVETLEPKETYNQEVWGNQSPGCGTSACIAGWATLKMGSKLGVEPSWHRLSGTPEGRSMVIKQIDEPTYEEWESHRAVGDALGFSDYETQVIFGSTTDSDTRAFFGPKLHGESDAQRAARRLREFACSASLDPSDPMLKRISPEPPQVSYDPLEC